MKYWLRSFVAGVLASISMMAPVLANETPTNPLDDEAYCQVTEGMGKVATLAREGRSHIDRSAFDLSESLDRLDYEAEKIIAFVRHSIAFEQYAGSLRGPKGTLLSLAGNALDQSLLLGSLLNDAGFEARIARTTLDEKSATHLLRQMTYPAAKNGLDKISPQLATSLIKLSGSEAEPAELLRKLESAVDPETDADFQKVQKTTRFLRKALADAGAKLGRTSDVVSLIEEAKDYFWVQYKGLAADDWIDVHPAFVDNLSRAASKPSSFMASTVPNDLLHRVRIEFFIERSTGGKLVALPVAPPWERPVANLVDTPITFAVLPTNISADTFLEQSVSEAIGEAATFTTTFNGSVLPDGQSFDLLGNLVDASAASNPAAGVIANVGKRFGSAVKSLGGDVPILTAHWVQITLIAPNGSERSFRRTTLDRIGPAARAQGEAPRDLTPTGSEEALGLLRKHSIMIAAGRTPTSLVIDRNFDWALRAEPLYRQSMAQVAYRAFDELEAPKAKSLPDVPVYWPGHLSLASTFDRASSMLASHRLYRAGPGVFIHVRGQRSADTRFELIDIVANARRAVSIDGKVPQLDPAAAIVAGVWDTAKEGVLLKVGDRRMDTETGFAKAISSGKSLVTLLPGMPISEVTLSPDIQTLVEADLSRGFAVVLPNDQQRLEDAAWWRVNLNTGETVGQAMDGRGAAASEFLIVLGTAITVAALLYGVDKCQQEYKRCTNMGGPMGDCSTTFQCCMGLNFAYTVAGMFSPDAIFGIAWDGTTVAAPSPCSLI